MVGFVFAHCLGIAGYAADGKDADDCQYTQHLYH